MKKYALILIAVCFFSVPLVQAGGIVELPETADRPTWTPGDTWIYEISYSGYLNKNKATRKMVVREATDQQFVVAVGNSFYLYNKNLNLQEIRNKSGQVTDLYYPELPWFRWPLKAGAWWGKNYTYTDFRVSAAAANNPPYVHVTIEVLGIEPLTVAGEELAAFKLQEKRYNPSGKCVMNQLFWFAPAVKNIIRWKAERLLIGKGDAGEMVKFVPGEK